MWTWGGNPPMMRTQNSIKDTTSAQTRKFEILTVGIIYKKKAHRVIALLCYRENYFLHKFQIVQMTLENKTRTMFPSF